MDIKPWDEVVILEDDNGWKNVHCLCDKVERNRAFLLSIKFPGCPYVVTDQNRDRVKIISRGSHE